MTEFDTEEENPETQPVEAESTEDAAVISSIAAEDAKDDVDELYSEEAAPEEPTKIIGKEKHEWLAKLKRPKFWLWFFGIVVLVLIFVWLITPSRLWLLNTLGFKASLNVTVRVAAPGDNPPRLKNATVVVNGQGYSTDAEGTVRIDAKYGATKIEVSKPGYESASSNPLIDFDPFFYLFGGKQDDQNILNQSFMLKSVGISFMFTTKDWLTDLPVTSGTYSIGDVSATPSGQGEVLLTIPATDQSEVELTIKFDKGYLNKTVAIPTNQNQQEVILVPAGVHYFLSKQSGALGLYSSNLDGSGVAEVLEPSSNETGDATFSSSPNQDSVIFASTREATRDSFGNVQQKLYAINAGTKKIQPVDEAIKFTLVDWYKDNLVYVASVRDASGALIQQLCVLSTQADAVQTLVEKSSGFNYVRVSGSSVVYMQAGGDLRTKKITGGVEKNLGTGMRAITQTDALVFAYQIADQTWRQYDVNSDQVTVTAAPTSLQRAFLASASQDGQTELLVDTIDGTLTLIAKNVGDGKEKTLATGAGLSPPIYWVGNVCVYRAGSADYAIDRSGNYPPKKITDVSQTSSAAQSYFSFN